MCGEPSRHTLSLLQHRGECVLIYMLKRRLLCKLSTPTPEWTIQILERYRTYTHHVRKFYYLLMTNYDIPTIFLHAFAQRMWFTCPESTGQAGIPSNHGNGGGGPMGMSGRAHAKVDIERSTDLCNKPPPPFVNIVMAHRLETNEGRCWPSTCDTVCILFTSSASFPSPLPSSPLSSSSSSSSSEMYSSKSLSVYSSKSVSE